MPHPRPQRGRHSLEALAQTVSGPEDQRLLDTLGNAIEQIDLLLGDEGPHERRQALARQPPGHRNKLAILRALLEMQGASLRPELDHRAPLGHACRSIDEALELEPGLGLAVLEELADLELLQRDIVNRVHVCPKCERCQINFIETCLECDSIAIEIERLVHHFHCGYSGLESEFTVGLDLVCPRCRRKLFQLGQDFERPHDTYVCHDCDRIFEEPTLRAQCFRCGHAFEAKDAPVVDVHEYRPTALTVRAVELGRLTGLDVSAVMYDANVRLATEDYLELEIEREAHRIRRHGGSIAGARLHFQAGGLDYPIFRKWKVDEIRQLSGLLTSTLRPLDLVARLDSTTVGLFFPETDAPGLEALAARLLGSLGEFCFTTASGQPLVPRWSAASWSGTDDAEAQAKALFGLDRKPT